MVCTFTLRYIINFCCSVKSPRPPIVSISAVIDKRYMYTALASILILYTLYITCMYLLNRIHGLSEGVVLDVRLHEQPTGLSPVQRTSLYTKKLTWCSKLKPPHSFTTATSNASAIRHRLGSSSNRKGMITYFVNCSQCIMLLILIFLDYRGRSSTPVINR